MQQLTVRYDVTYKPDSPLLSFLTNKLIDDTGAALAQCVLTALAGVRVAPPMASSVAMKEPTLAEVRALTDISAINRLLQVRAGLGRDVHARVVQKTRRQTGAEANHQGGDVSDVQVARDGFISTSFIAVRSVCGRSLPST